MGRMGIGKRTRFGSKWAVILGSVATLSACSSSSNPSAPVSPDGGVEAGTGDPRFAQAATQATVPVGYSQVVEVTVLSGNKDAWIFAKPDGTVNDIIYNFVGKGSTDGPFLLPAGKQVKLRLGITSPEAEKPSYKLPIALYTVDSEDTDLDKGRKLGTATVEIDLRFPVVNFDVARVSEDETTLAQTWRITNRGDDLHNVTIDPNDELGERAVISPRPSGVSLAAGGVLDFVVAPKIYPGFSAAAGEVEVNGGGKRVSTPVQFALPASSEIRLGFGFGATYYKGPLASAASAICNAFVGAMQCLNLGHLVAGLCNAGQYASELVSGVGIFAGFQRASEAVAASQASLGGDGNYSPVSAYGAAATMWILKNGHWIQAIRGRLGGNTLGPEDPKPWETRVLATPKAPNPYRVAEGGGLDEAQVSQINSALACMFDVEVFMDMIAQVDKARDAALAAKDKRTQAMAESAARAYARVVADLLPACGEKLGTFLDGTNLFDTPAKAADVRALQDQVRATGTLPAGPFRDEVRKVLAAEEAARPGAMAAIEKAIVDAILAADPDAAAKIDKAAFKAFWTSGEVSVPSYYGARSRYQPADGASTIINAAFQFEFSANVGRCAIKPFDVNFFLGTPDRPESLRPIGSLSSLIPEGTYQIVTDGSVAVENNVTIESNLNPGDSSYVRRVGLITQHAMVPKFVVVNSTASMSEMEKQAAADRAASLPGADPSGQWIIGKDNVSLVIDQAKWPKENIHSQDGADDDLIELPFLLTNFGQFPVTREISASRTDAFSPAPDDDSAPAAGVSSEDLAYLSPVTVTVEPWQFASVSFKVKRKHLRDKTICFGSYSDLATDFFPADNGMCFRPENPQPCSNSMDVIESLKGG